jgi:Cd2+/Zn2+-exporting ATPase
MPPTAECVIPLEAHCRACAERIERRIGRAEGVTNARVEHGEGRAVLRFDPSVLPAEQARTVAERVAAATPHREEPHGHAHGGTAGLWAVAVLWIIGIGLRLVDAAPLLFGVIELRDAFLLVAVALGGWPILVGAARSIRRRRLGINVLITVAAVGAAAIGELFEAASLVVLFGLSEWLEHRAKGRAHRMVEELLDGAPDTAIVLCEGRRNVLPVEAIGAGQRILVRPGDRIGLDGVVNRGSSWVNEAAITGESRPVSKSTGDTVYAGSLNGDGALEVNVTRDAGHSAIARIAQLVSEALANRPKIQRVVDRFAKVYTPIVVFAAVLVVLIPLVLGLPARPWILRALTFLVVSCPCAFVISLPATMAAALSAGARSGLVIKGAEYLERAARTGVVAFDKTGTLTTGQLDVEILPFEGEAPTELLRLAAALESSSEHPIGKAIARRAEGILLPAVEDFRAIPGVGVKGSVDGVTYVLGKPDLLPGEAFDAERPSQLDDRMVVLGSESRVLGGFRLRDRLRSDAADVVSELQRMGIRSALVTGDRRGAAEECAASAGIVDVYSDLLPHEKQELIAQLRGSEAVCMVGDGINDAPSLATADVGIAMGVSAAITAEAGDVVLADGGLSGVPKLIRLARRALTVARANMIVALALKAAVVGLSLAGVTSLALAVVVGDVGATLLVTINAIRLARARL